MSNRIAWGDAHYTAVRAEPKGTRIGEDRVTGEVGLVLTADGDTLVLEGTREQVRLLLTDALARLDGVRA